MKNLFKIIFVFALISLASCGSDDDCTADSFVGNYGGEVECNGASAAGTLTVTKISDSQIQLTDPDGADYTLDVDGCEATFSESLLGLGDIDIELTLDGDKLKIKQTSSIFGISATCEGTFDRQ